MVRCQKSRLARWPASSARLIDLSWGFQDRCSSGTRSSTRRVMASSRARSPAATCLRGGSGRHGWLGLMKGIDTGAYLFRSWRARAMVRRAMIRRPDVRIGRALSLSTAPFPWMEAGLTSGRLDPRLSGGEIPYMGEKAFPHIPSLRLLSKGEHPTSYDSMQIVKSLGSRSTEVCHVED